MEPLYRLWSNNLHTLRPGRLFLFMTIWGTMRMR